MIDWVRPGIWVRAKIGGPYDAFVASYGRRVPRGAGIVRPADLLSPYNWVVQGEGGLYATSERLAQDWEPIVDPLPDGSCPPSLEERLSDALGYVPLPTMMARLVAVVKAAL